MRKIGVALAAAWFVLLAARATLAQGHHRSGGAGSAATSSGASKPGSGGPLNLQGAQLGSVGIANDARQKMRAGDCAAALDLFDRALATSLDVTLYRDRGTCHEKLGHPYPAMDDYRTYVTAAPDAPDAAAIREKLERLEEDTTGSGRSDTASNDDVPPSDRIGSESPDGAGEPPKADGSAAPAPALGSIADEDAAEELRTPLRAGKGFGLAPLLGVRKWLRDGSSVGNSETWAESVGIEVRYSTAPHGALVLDLEYEHFNSTALDSEVVSGFSSFLGYEIRFPLNARYDDQLTLAPGIGYEQLGFSPGTSSASAYSEGGLTGILRFGYRHMLASSVALDVGLEGGAAYFFKFDSAVDSHDTVAGLVGARVGLLWGL